MPAISESEWAKVWRLEREREREELDGSTTGEKEGWPCKNKS